MKVFHNVKINQRKIPVRKRLFVLEDIDCADLKDIVTRREDRGDSKPEAASKGLIKGIDGTMQAMEPEPELTLASLLEVLDGVMEMPGRMMVITTNHPDRLDSALIRPGRVDVNLQFGKCSQRDVIDIYRNFYGGAEVGDDVEVKGGLWTPAEVTQIFLNNINCPQTAILKASSM